MIELRPDDNDRLVTSWRKIMCCRDLKPPPQSRHAPARHDILEVIVDRTDFAVVHGPSESKGIPWNENEILHDVVNSISHTR